MPIALESQKQPPEVFYKQLCPQKFREIHRKTPLPESFLIKLQAFSEHLFYTEHPWGTASGE